MAARTSTRPFPPATADRRLIALRYWLSGIKYMNALRTLEINRRLFPGLRKDGITPEFDHHVVQANFMRNLIAYLLFPEETICTIFFHDTLEDRGMSPSEVSAFFPDKQFGDRVSGAAWRMTKKWRGGPGAEPTPEAQFDAMSQCPVSSICKGVDRMHNLQSMVGVFSPEKQAAYLKETEEYILPMLKLAERNFPEQEPAYKIVRTVIKMQMELIQVSLAD